MVEPAVPALGHALTSVIEPASPLAKNIEAAPQSFERHSGSWSTA